MVGQKPQELQPPPMNGVCPWKAANDASSFLFNHLRGITPNRSTAMTLCCILYTAPTNRVESAECYTEFRRREQI